MTSYHRAHLVHDPKREVVWKAIARHLAPNVRKDSHVLELGAGYCHWINNVEAARRIAVDLWSELPAHAGPGVEALVVDIAEGLPSLFDESFDVVLASNLLEHFSPDAAATVVDTITRLLRPGGRLIVIQPNFRYAWRSYFDDYTHRVDLHRRLAPGIAACSRLRYPGGRAPISSLLHARHPFPGDGVARQGLPDVAVQTSGRADARYCSAASEREAGACTVTNG